MHRGALICGKCEHEVALQESGMKRKQKQPRTVRVDRSKPVYRKVHEAAYKRVRVVAFECQCKAIFLPVGKNKEVCPACGGKLFLVDTYNERKQRSSKED